MPNAGSQFSSDYLSEEQMQAAIAALPQVLKQLVGNHEIVARYGWAAHLHTDLCFVPMNSHTDTVQYLIEDSIEQQIISPGKSDILFEIPKGRLHVMFCHESDIHLDGSDEELLHRFMATPPYSQWRWHTAAEVRKSLGRSE